MNTVKPTALSAFKVLSLLPLAWRSLWFVVLVFAALLLILGSFRPLALPDEGRYAEIGRWMVVSGDWLIPRLNGIAFFHKPPLLYWLEGGVIALTGAKIWAVRLIPAAHAGALLACAAGALRPLLGETLARRSVIIYGSSAAFLLGGQYINHDMMVACWISVAIGSFGWVCIRLGEQKLCVDGESEVARGGLGLMGVARLGFAACALGVLSKGLIGVVLPGAVLVIWLSWSGRWTTVKQLPWFSGVLIFSALALPWFIFAEHAYPGMIQYMFGVHQLSRFTGTQFNNAQPLWFYLAAVSLLLGPWSVWFWLDQGATLYTGAQRLRGKLRAVFTKPKDWLVAQASNSADVRATGARARSVQEMVCGLCVIWVWTIVIFFSIPSSKIIGYALPVMIPVAVLSAVGWERVMLGNRFKGVERFVFKGFVAVSLALTGFVNFEGARVTRQHSSEDIAAYIRCAHLERAQWMVVGEYPYDLPYLVQLRTPLWVLQDWAYERANAGDNWRRELFEGAEFERSRDAYLRPLSELAVQANHPDVWLVSTKHWSDQGQLEGAGYKQIYSGTAWNIYATPATHPAQTAQETAENADHSTPAQTQIASCAK